MRKIGNKDLAKVLVDKFGLDKTASDQFITDIFEVIGDGLRKEKIVKIKGLGTFKVTSVAPRKSVDVNTGESIVIEGRDKISFTAETAMRDLVNKPFAQFDTVIVNDGVDFDDIDDKYSDSLLEQEEQTDMDSTVSNPPMQTESYERGPLVISDETVIASEQSQNVISVNESESLIDSDKEEQEVTMTEVEEAPSDSISELPYLNENEIASETVETEEQTTFKEQPSEAETKQQTHEIEEDSLPVEQTAEPLLEPVEESKEGPSPEEENLEEHQSEYDAGLELLNNQIEDLTENVNQQKRHMRIILGVSAFVFAFFIGGLVYLLTQLDRRDNRIRHLEAVAALALQPQESPAKAKVNQDSIAAEKAKADSVALAQKKVAKAAAKMQAEKTALEEAKKTEAAKKLAVEKAEEAKKTAQINKYNSDVRVRTGAYNIIGIDQTVTVRSGQTLSSISKTYLGPGMECYVEAVNEGRTTFKVGEKVSIPKLKLKKKGI